MTIDKLNDFLGVGIDGKRAVGVLTLTRKSGITGIIPIEEGITFRNSDLFYESAFANVKDENPAEISESQNFVPYAIRAIEEGSKYNLELREPGWQADRQVDFTILNEGAIAGGVDPVGASPFWNHMRISDTEKQDVIDTSKAFILKLIGQEALPDKPEIDRAVLLYCNFLVYESQGMTESTFRAGEELSHAKRPLADFAYQALLSKIQNLLSGHRDISKYFTNVRAG